MSADKEFTYSDVSEHNTKKDLYIVVHDKVYNASSFVDEHPYVRCPTRRAMHRTSAFAYSYLLWPKAPPSHVSGQWSQQRLLTCIQRW